MTDFDINSASDLTSLVAKRTLEYRLLEEFIKEGIKEVLKSVLRDRVRSEEGFVHESIDWEAVAAELGAGQPPDVRQILTKLEPRIIAELIREIDFNSLIKEEALPPVSETRVGYPKHWKPLLG